MHREFTVEPLSAHPTLVDVLAAWHHAEFGHLYDPKIWNRAIARQELAAMAITTGDGESDRTWVAFDRETPVGSISLLATDDVAGFDHLTPWIANLYVRPGSRRLGLGRHLVDLAVDHARKTARDRVHLFTSDAVDFYLEQGWQVIATLEQQGHRATVLARATRT